MNSRHVGVALTRRRRHPVGGFVHLGFATNFLLGEIELPPSASKGDPTGRTAVRTHKCRCDKLRWVSCPYCSASFLVKQTAEDWNSFDGSAAEARSLPLIGTCVDSRCFVEKAHMDHALHSDASFLVDHSGAKFDTSRVTGHEMRRAWPLTLGENEIAVKYDSVLRSVKWNVCSGICPGSHGGV